MINLSNINLTDCYPIVSQQIPDKNNKQYSLKKTKEVREPLMLTKLLISRPNH